MTFYVKKFRYIDKYVELQNKIENNNDKLIIKIFFSKELNNHIHVLFNNENFNIDTCINNAFKNSLDWLLPAKIKKDNKTLMKFKDICFEYINILKKKYLYYIKKSNINNDISLLNNKLLLIVLNYCLLNYYPSYIYNPIYYPTNIRYINRI